MSRDLAISAAGLGKQYLLSGARQRHDSLRDAIVAGVSSILRPKSWGEKTEAFWALRDVNFQIEHGENVGIVGLNGAGKSTLLKILSRITVPTTGQVRLNGRVGALLEVGTGFKRELTGRENVFLYGSILGMRKEEIRRKFDAIVDFSGIEKFIDTPVKRYSSGMYVRLAFAVAAHLDPDILLLDEVLAVGDLAFQRKCLEHAKELQRKDATILFVSHNMFSIKSMCDRVIYLRNGAIEYDGSVEGGIERYEKDCTLAPGGSRVDTRSPIKFTGIELTGEQGQPKTVFEHGERMKIRLKYETTEPVADPSLIVAMIRSDGVACCNFSSELDGVSFGRVEGSGTVELTTPPLSLVAEVYTLHILVRKRGFSDLLSSQIGCTFHVRHDVLDTHFGVFHEPAQWRWQAAGRPRVETHRARKAAAGEV